MKKRILVALFLFIFVYLLVIFIYPSLVRASSEFPGYTGVPRGIYQYLKDISEDACEMKGETIKTYINNQNREFNDYMIKNNPYRLNLKLSDNDYILIAEPLNKYKRHRYSLFVRLLLIDLDFGSIPNVVLKLNLSECNIYGRLVTNEKWQKITTKNHSFSIGE